MSKLIARSTMLAKGKEGTAIMKGRKLVCSLSFAAGNRPSMAKFLAALEELLEDHGGTPRGKREGGAW